MEVSVGAAADVTGPNLYVYFASKADLLRAVYERGTHQLWIGLDAALGAARTPEGALPGVLKSYVDNIGASASFGVGRSGEREIEADSLGAQREYVAEWTALVQRASPGTDATTARLRVQIGLKVIVDLLRTPHLARPASAPGNIVTIVGAVLASCRGRSTAPAPAASTWSVCRRQERSRSRTAVGDGCSCGIPGPDGGSPWHRAGSGLDRARIR